LLFQTFDDKKNCATICAVGELHQKKLPKKLTKTWSYAEFLKDQKDVEYASIYCHGQSLEEACPPYLKNNWEETNNRLKAFYRAVNEAKLDLNEHCFFDMVPTKFLLEYAKIKDKICAHVFQTKEKPKNYEHFLSLIKILTEIKNKKINVDYSELNNRMHEYKVRQFVKKNKVMEPYVNYNPYGTKTGRLSAKNSFPILTMDKTYRKIIKPTNDWFLELDFNAAELRVLFGLLGKEQPEGDLHSWNLKNVFNDVYTRERAKKRVFAWLYNPDSKDDLLNKVYNRDLIKKKHWDGNKITTVFNREIKSDEFHAVNYIIQSTAADLFLQQMIKVWDLLENKDSYIAFCVHDSLVIDYSEKDAKILTKLKKTFSETQLGNFLVNARVGKDYGRMKALKL
tara:strand:+ start:6369 stop:7556 length:1188 start_codon:yes stop_codon:yes gene_type:complete